jgi:hypothetical protein
MARITNQTIDIVMNCHAKEAVLLGVATFSCVSALVVLFTGVFHFEAALVLLLIAFTASWMMIGNLLQRHRR